MKQIQIIILIVIAVLLLMQILTADRFFKPTYAREIDSLISNYESKKEYDVLFRLLYEKFEEGYEEGFKEGFESGIKSTL